MTSHKSSVDQQEMMELEELFPLAEQTPRNQTNKSRSKRKLPETSMSTAECRPASKKTTLLARSKPCKADTPTISSSQISGQASTGKDGDCELYWNEACKELSKRLWWPTETDCVATESGTAFGALDSNCSSSSSTTTKQHSPWKTVHLHHPNKNLPKTSWQSCKSLVVANKVSEDTRPSSLPNKSKTKTKKTWVNKREQVRQKQQSQAADANDKRQEKKQKNTSNLKVQKIRLLPDPNDRLLLETRLRHEEKSCTTCYSLISTHKYITSFVCAPTRAHSRAKAYCGSC